MNNKITQVTITDKNLISKIREDLTNYINFNKLSNEEIFNKEIFDYTIDTSNWVNDGVYYHLNVQPIWKIKEDIDFKNYVNGQTIEYYLIKDISDNLTQLNKKIKENELEKYVKNNWYTQVSVNRNWKNKVIYIKYDKKGYFQAIFHQDGIWYEKNIENLVEWYLMEFIMWKFLYLDYLNWKISSFDWTNKFDCAIFENWNEISFEYEIWKEWTHDFEIISNENNVSYVDIKSLIINNSSNKALSDGGSWFYNYKFYIPISTVNKAYENNKNIVFVPMFHNDYNNNIFLYDYTVAPDVKQIKAELKEIITNSEFLAWNKKWKGSTEIELWRRFKQLFYHTKEDKKNQWLTEDKENIKILNNNVSMPVIETSSAKNSKSLATFYWNWAKSKGKRMRKIW